MVEGGDGLDGPSRKQSPLENSEILEQAVSPREIEQKSF
jgi:hypothetical protein